MPERLPVATAGRVLERLVLEESEVGSDLTLDQMIRVFEQFKTIDFLVPDDPDSDGFLFQYGIFGDPQRSAFVLSLVRQLELCDAEGEHEAYIQVRCELSYEPDECLAKLGSRELWWFRGETGGSGSSDAWIADISSMEVWNLVREKVVVSAKISH